MYCDKQRHFWQPPKKFQRKKKVWSSSSPPPKKKIIRKHDSTFGEVRRLWYRRISPQVYSSGFFWVKDVPCTYRDPTVSPTIWGSLRRNSCVHVFFSPSSSFKIFRDPVTHSVGWGWARESGVIGGDSSKKRRSWGEEICSVTRFFWYWRKSVSPLSLSLLSLSLSSLSLSLSLSPLSLKLMCPSLLSCCPTSRRILFWRWLLRAFLWESCDALRVFFFF